MSDSNTQIDQYEVEQHQIQNYFDISFAAINLTDGNFVTILPNEIGVIVCHQQLNCKLRTIFETFHFLLIV